MEEGFNWTLLFICLFLIVFSGFATEAYKTKSKEGKKTHKTQDKTKVAHH